MKKKQETINIAEYNRLKEENERLRTFVEQFKTWRGEQ